MVTFREIVKGAISRFLPGAVVGQAAMIAFLLIGEPSGLALRDLPILAGFTALMTIGHAGALGVMRRMMRDDADVSGRRALIAGLAAGAFHFGIAAAVSTFTENQGFALAVFSGAAAATAMFFPWIRAQRPEAEFAPSIPADVMDEMQLPPSTDEWPLRDVRAEPERVKRNS